MKKFYNLLCVFLILSGCNTNKKTGNWDKENTRNVTVTDSVYLNSIKLARENLPVFIDSLKNKKTNHYDFYIKSKYTEGENTEHLWFIVDTLEGQTLAVTLDNVPLNLKNIKLNDRLKIKIDKVEDWIIYKGDSIVSGNYIGKTIEK